MSSTRHLYRPRARRRGGDGDPLERAILAYIARVYPVQREDVRRALEAARPDRAQELEMTVAKEWLEEGRQEGRQEAELQALEEKRETVRHLLAFGVLSDEQIAEATGLSVDEIAKLRIEDKH